jgi:hypothetical protein
MSNIADLDQYSKQFQTVVTIESLTLNTEPISLDQTVITARLYVKIIKAAGSFQGKVGIITGPPDLNRNLLGINSVTRL